MCFRHVLFLYPKNFTTPIYSPARSKENFLDFNFQHLFLCAKSKAPDYFEVIKTPMDFSTIKNNINHFKYADYTSIIADTRLVFTNCCAYNEPGSNIYETGVRMSQFFESRAKKAGLLDTKQLASPYTSNNGASNHHKWTIAHPWSDRAGLNFFSL